MRNWGQILSLNQQMCFPFLCQARATCLDFDQFSICSSSIVELYPQISRLQIWRSIKLPCSSFLFSGPISCCTLVAEGSKILIKCLLISLDKS